MKKVTPRDFRDAFAAVVRAEENSLRTAAGFEAKSYLYFMRSNIFPRVARHLGLLTWNKEYCALDAIFYEERGRDGAGRYTPYAKWIAVALEHAFKPAKTPDDINKLQMYNAPLKVLVTYAQEAEDEQLLRKYAAIIGESDVFGDAATLRKQLVIFGTPRQVRDWRYYAYEDDGFVLMLPG